MPPLEEELAFGPAGEYSGFRVLPPSHPEDRPLPSVLLIQEGWGLDAHLRGVARRLAEAGYAALAPDLFARGGVRLPGLDVETLEEAKAWMDTLPPGAWQDPTVRAEAVLSPRESDRNAAATLRRLFGGATLEAEGHLKVLIAGLDLLESGTPATRGGKRAGLGFCLGGGLCAELASRTASLSGAVVFYGTPPQRPALASIACPVLGFFGESDAQVNAALPDFEKGMREEGKALELHVLKGAGHAFLNDARSGFHPEAARYAWARTYTFLNEVLG